MPEDTVLYVFCDDQGRRLAVLDEAEARLFRPATAPSQEIVRTTLGELYRLDAHALVRARAQFYWAEDLMIGRAYGALS
jgi:hypothetical protein